jgi:hypothetical protein
MERALESIKCAAFPVASDRICMQVTINITINRCCLRRIPLCLSFKPRRIFPDQSRRLSGTPCIMLLTWLLLLRTTFFFDVMLIGRELVMGATNGRQCCSVRRRSLLRCRPRLHRHGSWEIFPWLHSFVA